MGAAIGSWHSGGLHLSPPSPEGACFPGCGIAGKGTYVKPALGHWQ